MKNYSTELLQVNFLHENLIEIVNNAFFSYLIDNIEELIPIVYTPTGLSVNYQHIINRIYFSSWSCLSKIWFSI